jgi:hypothetical protein
MLYNMLPLYVFDLYFPSMSSYTMTMMFIPISGTRLGVSSRCSEHKRNRWVTRTPHDSSHSTYQVDKPALHANILRRVPVSAALIIVLLKPNAIR